ncbi:MAG: hypothetical protein ABI581_06810 [Sediminibacterium sp.]
MKQKVKHFRHTKQSKVILVLSVLVAAYWYLGKTLDVYGSKFTGAISEILWLPMIILLFVLPIVSIGFFIKEKFSIKSLYLYSLLIGAGAILITILM